MINYKHFTGPSYPICHYPGTRVLDPYQHQTNQVTQDEAIHILMCRDPRRTSRHKDCSEGYRLKYRK